jgi:hypothetical protein
MNQALFDPIHYGFKWTADWYEFDRTKAMRAARNARDAVARKMRKQGREVRCFTIRDQLRTKGGIGTGHPQIEEVVNVYGINYRER